MSYLVLQLGVLIPAAVLDADEQRQRGLTIGIMMLVTFAGFVHFPRLCRLPIDASDGRDVRGARQDRSVDHAAARGYGGGLDYMGEATSSEP